MFISARLLLPALFFCSTIGCSDSDKEADQTEETRVTIDPKALSLLDEAIGNYRMIVTSLKNSGLSDEKFRDLSNQADFLLRDLTTYIEAKKISLSASGITDVGELADNLKYHFNLYDARFLKPHQPKQYQYYRDYSQVYLDDDIDKSLWKIDSETNYNSNSIPFSVFAELVSKHPSLAEKFYIKYGFDPVNFEPVEREHVEFAVELGAKSNSTEEFLKQMSQRSGSGYHRYSDGTAEIIYWELLVDGKYIKALVLTDIEEILDEVNLAIKKNL